MGAKYSMLLTRNSLEIIIFSSIRVVYILIEVSVSVCQQEKRQWNPGAWKQ